jgi:hypothetical protein
MADEISEQPAPEYTEMADAYAPTDEGKKVYEGNEPDALRDAAGDLDDERRKREAKAPRVTELDEPLERKYYRTENGRFTGEESPSHETLSLKRASDDLTRVRAEEQAVIDASADARVAEVTDAIREELAPQQPQAEQPQQPPASDEEEMQRALANPRIRQALETEVNKLEAQRSQYAQAAAQAFELSAAATFAQFPELNGVTQQTLQPVLHAVAQNNPDRARSIVSALQGTERLHQQSQQAQAAQAQIAQAKQAIWFKAENDRFDSWAAANESKATMDEVMREGRRVLKEAYNIDADQLGQMLRENPGLRSAEAQRMIYDSIKLKLAQEKIGAKRAPAPPVQRPGVSQPLPSYSDEEASGALARFNKNPTALTASQYLTARRAAKQR